MIYLDHTATMVPTQEILEFYCTNALTYAANPAAVHSAGFSAKKALSNALDDLAKTFGCRSEELIITSGGTESINQALKGTLAANQRLGRKLIISEGEHSAVKETAKWLETKGYKTARVSLEASGKIDLDKLKAALEAEPCALLSVIYVNNETGAVNPIEEIVALKEQVSPQTLIHLDGVQATGRLPWSFQKLQVDLFSGSGHKFATPKGIGWLISKNKLLLEPLLHGGGQQRNLRSGTENTPLVMTMALAARQAYAELNKKNEYIAALRQTLLDRLSALGVSYNQISPPDAVPGILSIAFKGLRGETLLHALAKEKIYVSTGSACSAAKKNTSSVLKAMKLPAKIIDSSIRVSLATSNTKDEIIRTAEAIAVAVDWLGS